MIGQAPARLTQVTQQVGNRHSFGLKPQTSEYGVLERLKPCLQGKIGIPWQDVEGRTPSERGGKTTEQETEHKGRTKNLPVGGFWVPCTYFVLCTSIEYPCLDISLLVGCGDCGWKIEFAID